LTCKGLCGRCLSEFIDLEIQSVMLVFSTQLCELLPLYPSLWFNAPPSPFPVSTYSIYRQCVTGGGGEVLSLVGGHILQEFNTLYLTRFRTYKIARPSQTKT
jgi:hypothetical protein